MSEEDEEKLRTELVNRVASNLSFSEVVNIISSLCSNEIDDQMKSMSEEEKLNVFNEVFSKEV
jgi:hypothetical protein